MEANRTGTEMSTTNAAKCAHPICSCMTTSGKFCIVTLSGQVVSENYKSQAENIAKSLAGAQVVADQIAVVPVGVEKEAKAMNSDLDSGIEKNLDAALIQNNLHGDVNYEVTSGVVTLTGHVNSQSKRDRAEKVALTVPNVKQVVNDLQVRNQKASSSQ